MGILSGLLGKSTKHIPPVCSVDLTRYLGKWYEIARLPHSFEEGLEQVTAEYKLKNDGSIEVINSGYKNGKQNTAKGTAQVADKSCSGILKVSFFKFIKSEYKIIRLDEKDYSFSVVTGSTMKYFWILCRKPEISTELYSELISYAASKGFEVSKIIKVKQ